jgi:hypothetical protein
MAIGGPGNGVSHASSKAAITIMTTTEAITILLPQKVLEPVWRPPPREF